MKSMNNSISLALSLHGYGRSILHPYSCQQLATSLNASILTLFDYTIQEFLQGIHYKYTTGQSWQVPGLYSVNGEAVDYLYHQFSVPSFSVELPPSYPQIQEINGFWPSISSVRNECNQLLFNALKSAGCNVRLAGRFLENRGFGNCYNLSIRIGKQQYSIHRLLCWNSSSF